MKKWTRVMYQPNRPLKEGCYVTASKEHIALSREAAAEGMVLLKNEHKLLPLKAGSRIALFGKGSFDYVKGGGGSGDVTVAYVRNLCDGMEEKENAGMLSVFAPLNEFYRENVAQQHKAGKNPGYTTEPEVPAELLKQAARECDTAIISICRFSAEGWDRKGEPDDGDFYLSREEQRMVADVTAAFRKVVVVLNVGGMVDTSWFAHNDKISSVLLAWQGGMEGAMAEADILCGNVTPSGKLTDTFAASFDDYSSSSDFNDSEDYVCYTDDIFVGYRYFETIPGAAEKVNYPFGFGLSYMWAPCRTASLMRWSFPKRATTHSLSFIAPAHRPPARIWQEPSASSLTMQTNWKWTPIATPYGAARQEREWRRGWGLTVQKPLAAVICPVPVRSSCSTQD